MKEIGRHITNPDGSRSQNPEFLAILDGGKKTWHSPLLECSGVYAGSIEFGGKVYETWVNWGHDCVYELYDTDLENRHQDREGRVGETYRVDNCRTDRDAILRNVAPVSAPVVRKMSDGWGSLSTE